MQSVTLLLDVDASPDLSVFFQKRIKHLEKGIKLRKKDTEAYVLPGVKSVASLSPDSSVADPSVTDS